MFAGAEAFVSVAEDLNDLVGSDFFLQFASGVIDVLDVVAEVVAIAEALQTELHVVSRGDGFFEIANEVEHIGIDVMGVAGIQKDMRTWRRIAESCFQRRSVEEANLVGQFDVQYIAAEVLFDDAIDRAAIVAVEDETQADGQADEDSDDEIGEHDGD